MICLKHVVILATAVVLAYLGAAEAIKFGDLPENERGEVLELLSQAMEETQLSPLKIIHAGLEKIYEDSASQVQENHQGEIHQQPEAATSNLEYTFGELKPIAIPSNQQGAQTDAAVQNLTQQTSVEAAKPPPASEKPEDEFEQDSYIDDSDPQNPEEVHMRKRKRVEVSPNGGSEVHEVSRSSQTIDPNSPYKHRSSSIVSSSSSYSKTSNHSEKPSDGDFADQPAMSWPKFSQMAPIPPIPGMPPMPPMPPMPMMPFGVPVPASGAWRGFYPMGGMPGTVPYVASEPMSNRQAKKLARRQMWEARKKQPDAEKQQAHV